MLRPKPSGPAAAHRTQQEQQQVGPNEPGVHSSTCMRGKRRQVVMVIGLIGHEKMAPPAYLAQRHIDIFDVGNRLVHSGSATAVRHALARATARVRRIDPKGKYLRVACFRVKDLHLIFATTLSPAALAARFPRLDACQAATPQPKREHRAEESAAKLQSPARPVHRHHP